jgi:AAA domain-containing protein
MSEAAQAALESVTRPEKDEAALQAQVKPQASALSVKELFGAASPMESVPYIKELIYADPGGGKTYHLGTSAFHEDFYPMLLLDVEGGAMTLRKFPQDRILVKQVRRMQDMEEQHKKLLENPGMVKSVGLDSLTELQKLDMNTVMKQRHEDNPDKIDPDVPDQRAWGKSGERIRKIVRAYRDLPLHFFATCHVQEREDERTGRVTVYPSLPGKLRAEIPGFFDIVGYLRAVQEGGDPPEVVRIVQFAKTDRVIAKDRTGALGDMMRNPTIPLMWEMINNNTEGANINGAS